MKVKITKENQPCRKCGSPVKKLYPKTPLKEGQTYYYDYYFKCFNCITFYMVDAVKRIVSHQASNSLTADNK